MMIRNGSDVLPQAILFDCDGTLLLTTELHFNAISGAIAAQGAKMPRDWYLALTGLGRGDLFARFSADFGVSLDLPRATADSIALTVNLADQARENPKVTALARAVCGTIPIALVTNSEAVIARSLLAATGMAGVFDAIITVEQALAPKPAPDLYLLAADRLGVAAPQCLALEDSPQGIAAAISAGITCLDVRDPAWTAIYDSYAQGVTGRDAQQGKAAVDPALKS